MAPSQWNLSSEPILGRIASAWHYPCPIHYILQVALATQVPAGPKMQWKAESSAGQGPLGGRGQSQAFRSARSAGDTAHSRGGAPRVGVTHTTEASPDTEATLLSSAQGCRFCSAKSEELCRQSGSGGSGGRSGRGSASCCRCNSRRPARCRSASRSSAVWRLGERRAGVRVAESPSPPLGPPVPRASPPLGASILEPGLNLRVGHAQGLGQCRPLCRGQVLLAQEAALQLQHLRAGKGGARLLALRGGPVLVGVAYATCPREGRERSYGAEEQGKVWGWSEVALRREPLVLTAPPPASTEASFKKGPRKNGVPPKLHSVPPCSVHGRAAEEGRLHPTTVDLSLLSLLCGTEKCGVAEGSRG